LSNWLIDLSKTLYFSTTTILVLWKFHTEGRKMRDRKVSREVAVFEVAAVSSFMCEKGCWERDPSLLRIIN
jgi:hypothetical protein